MKLTSYPFLAEINRLSADLEAATAKIPKTEPGTEAAETVEINSAELDAEDNKPEIGKFIF